MTPSSKPGSKRPTVQELLDFDRALVSWLKSQPKPPAGTDAPPLRVPGPEALPHIERSQGSPSQRDAVSLNTEAGRGATPRVPKDSPSQGFERDLVSLTTEAGRGATPRSAYPLAGFDEAGRGATPRSAYPLAGFDEAGRGALAGPVTVACVSFPLEVLRDPELLETRLAGLGDSKHVTPRNRERLYMEIVSMSSWGVGNASAVEVDRLGIVHACERAVSRARRAHGEWVATCMLDLGLQLSAEEQLRRDWRTPQMATMARADGHSFHVAAASIIAKVWRDRLMTRLDGRFPGYGFQQHKGYGTAQHRRLVIERGASAIHRLTFIRGLEVPESQSC